MRCSHSDQLRGPRQICHAYFLAKMTLQRPGPGALDLGKNEFGIITEHIVAEGKPGKNMPKFVSYLWITVTVNAKEPRQRLQAIFIKQSSPANNLGATPLSNQSGRL